MQWCPVAHRPHETSVLPNDGLIGSLHAKKLSVVESPDHTFKFANGLKLKDPPGKVFTASYTSVSRQGAITLSRPTCAKSNAEIEPIIARHHEPQKMLAKRP
jgi:hypothetical protein